MSVQWWYVDCHQCHRSRRLQLRLLFLLTVFWPVHCYLYNIILVSWLALLLSFCMLDLQFPSSLNAFSVHFYGLPSVNCTVVHWPTLLSSVNAFFTWCGLPSTTTVSWVLVLIWLSASVITNGIYCVYVFITIAMLCVAAIPSIVSVLLPGNCFRIWYGMCCCYSCYCIKVAVLHDLHNIRNNFYSTSTEGRGASKGSTIPFRALFSLLKYLNFRKDTVK